MPLTTESFCIFSILGNKSEKLSLRLPVTHFQYFHITSSIPKNIWLVRFWTMLMREAGIVKRTQMTRFCTWTVLIKNSASLLSCLASRLNYQMHTLWAVKNKMPKGAVLSRVSTLSACVCTIHDCIYISI